MEGELDGSLTLQGDFDRVTLAGVLDVAPFSMTLDTLLAQDIPELDVTEVYGRGRAAHLRDRRCKTHPLAEVGRVCKQRGIG